MDPTQHNYWRKLMSLIAERKMPLDPGGLTEWDVRHDDWCGIFGGGYCNCDPDVSVRPAAVTPGNPGGENPGHPRAASNDRPDPAPTDRRV